VAFQALMGDYVQSPDGGYRLTWAGAFRGVAILGMPFRAVRQLINRRRAAALAAELRRA
jgi:hypothetical protein